MAISPATALKIRLVILDVDGVMTDGGLYLGATEDGTPVELKRFSIQDGLGVKFMRRAGLSVAIVSGRVSKATTLRAEELSVDHVAQDDGARKLPVVEGLMESQGLSWDQVALLGDDLADLPVLERVGLAATVANGVPEVCRVATWQSVATGGHGAVREFAEALLDARGEWKRLVDEYCTERGS